MRARVDQRTLAHVACAMLQAFFHAVACGRDSRRRRSSPSRARAATSLISRSRPSSRQIEIGFVDRRARAADMSPDHASSSPAVDSTASARLVSHRGPSQASGVGKIRARPSAKCECRCQNQPSEPATSDEARLVRCRAASRARPNVVVLGFQAIERALLVGRRDCARHRRPVPRNARHAGHRRRRHERARRRASRRRTRGSSPACRAARRGARHEALVDERRDDVERRVADRARPTRSRTWQGTRRAARTARARCRRAGRSSRRSRCGSSAGARARRARRRRAAAGAAGKRFDAARPATGGPIARGGQLDRQRQVRRAADRSAATALRVFVGERELRLHGALARSTNSVTDSHCSRAAVERRRWCASGERERRDRIAPARPTGAAPRGWWRET